MKGRVEGKLIFSWICSLVGLPAEPNKLHTVPRAQAALGRGVRGKGPPPPIPFQHSSDFWNKIIMEL